MIFLIAVAVVIFLVLGVSLIYNSSAHAPDLRGFVSREEMSRIEQELIKAQGEQDKLKLQLDSMAVKLSEDQNKILDAEKIKESLKSLEEQGKAQTLAIRKLEEVKDIIAQKADSQAREAAQVIEALHEENQKLKQDVQKDAISPEELSRLSSLNQTLKEDADQNMARIRELEELLTRAQSSQASSEQAEALSLENQKLKDGLKQIHQKISSVETEFRQTLAQQSDAEFKAEEAQRSLTEAQARNQQFEKEIAALQTEKAGNEQRLNSLEAALAETQKQSQESRSQLEEQDWKKEKTALQENIAQLQAANENLKAKEKIILYQLTKSRAQIMGLDKICGDYKEQLEAKSLKREA